MELCTEITCEQCATPFKPKNRNGIRPRFCALACSRRWHNAERLKGAAMRKPRRLGRAQAPPQRKPRTLDELSAAEGLPPGSLAALLVEAARRVGIMEESAALTTARQRRAQEI